MKRRIVPGGILALSLAVVLLAATASTASAERVLSPWYCPPPPTQTTTLDQVRQECLDLGAVSFDFDDRQVGTTSPAQRFALGVWDTDTFTPDISVSGDYAQTNDCPPTLSVTGDQVQGCQITVTFAPTGTGARHGTLSAGPGGPDGGAHRHRGHHPDSVGLAPGAQGARRVSRVPARAGRDAGEEGEEGRASCHHERRLHRGGQWRRQKTTKRLAAGEKTKFEAKLKHLTRLNEKPSPKVKIKFAATDEFDQTATETIKVTVCVPRTPDECRGQRYWERGAKHCGNGTPKYNYRALTAHNVGCNYAHRVASHHFRTGNRLGLGGDRRFDGWKCDDDRWPMKSGKTDCRRHDTQWIRYYVYRHN